MKRILLSNPFEIERQPEVLSEALKADVNEIIGYMYLDDLLNKVRNQECIPSERKKGVLVELAKKDDIRICENWEVKHFSQRQVLSHMILNRIKMHKTRRT